MAQPKKRMSPVRSANRRRQIGLDLPATSVCPNCRSLMVKHQTCRVCGQYKGREVVSATSSTVK